MILSFKKHFTSNLLFTLSPGVKYICTNGKHLKSLNLKSYRESLYHSLICIVHGSSRFQIKYPSKEWEHMKHKHALSMIMNSTNLSQNICVF